MSSNLETNQTRKCFTTKFFAARLRHAAAERRVRSCSGNSRNAKIMYECVYMCKTIEECFAHTGYANGLQT